MHGLEYMWSYKFIQVMVTVLVAGLLGVLVFVGLSAGVVARRTRKVGNRGAFTIEQLNALATSHKKEVS